MMPARKTPHLIHDRLLHGCTASLHRLRASVRLFLTLSLLLAADAAVAADKLPVFTAKYGIEKYGVKLAEATYQLANIPTGYRFTQETHLYGLANMFRDDSISAESIVQAKGDSMLLLRHRYTQTGEEENRDETFTVEWEEQGSKLRGRITGIVRGKPVKLDTDKPVWEALSFQLPLMAEASEKKKRYRYYALLKGELDTYLFDLAATETIRFADKDYRALKLVRKNPEKNRELRIWLLPELKNIPVIVENMRDGKQHSYMKLESVSFDGQPPITDMADNSVDNIDDDI